MTITVNNNVEGNPGGAGPSATATISITTGHTIVALVQYNDFGGGGSITGVTDSSGANTYTLRKTLPDGLGRTFLVFDCIGIAHAVTSVTANASNSAGFPSVVAFDLSSGNTIAYSDSNGTAYVNNNPSTTDGVTTGTLSIGTASTGALLGICSDFSNGANISRGTGFTAGSTLFGNPYAEYKTTTVSAALTYTDSVANSQVLVVGGLYVEAAAAAAPFKPTDLDERVTTKVIASDFTAPNLLADQILKPPPLTQKESPAQAPRPRWSATDFNAPNLLADQVLKLPPFTQRELPGVMLRGRGITDFIHPNLIDSTLLPTAAPLTPVDLSQQVKAKAPATDFAPPNLLTQQTLKLPPFTLEEFPGWSLRARALGTDFTAPNLLSLTLTTPNAPLLAIDLSQQVKSRWVGSDFNPGNLLLGILPIPPVAPIDATVSIRAKGVFTDFSPPNLALSTLIPPAALYPIETALLRLEYRWIRGDDLPLNLLPLRLQTVAPIAPQDLSGLRLDARGLRSDFAPPNLTLTLPVPPPPPVSAAAGRHGTRRQARRRRELDVLLARIEAFKEQRADADRALIAIEDRELAARAKLLKRVRVKPLVKPIEQYAPIKKALAQRTVAADRYKSILGQIRAHQLEAERIQREIESEAADEEAALQLMHFLMMEIPWNE